MALFQRHSEHTGKRKRLKWDVDEGGKWSLGWEDHPRFRFPYHLFPFLLISFLSSLILSPTFAPFIFPTPIPTSFFSFQRGSHGTSAETETLSPQSSFGGPPVQQLLMAQPQPHNSQQHQGVHVLGFLLSFWICQMVPGLTRGHIYLYSYFFCQREQ